VETVMNRRPGVVGLNFLVPIAPTSVSTLPRHVSFSRSILSPGATVTMAFR
jgi:hypothetical protein